MCTCIILGQTINFANWQKRKVFDWKLLEINRKLLSSMVIQLSRDMLVGYIILGSVPRDVLKIAIRFPKSEFPLKTQAIPFNITTTLKSPPLPMWSLLFAVHCGEIICQAPLFPIKVRASTRRNTTRCPPKSTELHLPLYATPCTSFYSGEWRLWWGLSSSTY